MKDKTLLLMGLIVISCSQSGPVKETDTILTEIQSPKSTILYFRNIQSLPDEIAVLDKVLQQTDSVKTPDLYKLLSIQLNEAKEIKQSYDELVSNSIKKIKDLTLSEKPTPDITPPNYSQGYQTMALSSQCKRLPCPKDTAAYSKVTSAITFFTADSAATAKMYQNDSLIVLNTGKYYPAYRMRKLDIPQNLNPAAGDSIRFEMPIDFYNTNGILNRITIIYRQKM